MRTTQFAKLMGVIFILVGLMGFVPALMGPPADFGVNMTVLTGYGFLLGLFPVNVLHNLVHLLIGAWGWTASRTMAGSRAFARGLAVFYGALAVMGLIPGLNTMFGLIPIFGHDIWLHAGTAALAAYFGFGMPREVALNAEEPRRQVA